LPIADAPRPSEVTIVNRDFGGNKRIVNKINHRSIAECREIFYKLNSEDWVVGIRHHEYELYLMLTNPEADYMSIQGMRDDCKRIHHLEISISL
jgi:hypothetical protein